METLDPVFINLYIYLSTVLRLVEIKVVRTWSFSISDIPFKTFYAGPVLRLLQTDLALTLFFFTPFAVSRQRLPVINNPQLFEVPSRSRTVTVGAGRPNYTELYQIKEKKKEKY